MVKSVDKIKNDYNSSNTTEKKYSIKKKFNLNLLIRTSSKNFTDSYFSKTDKVIWDPSKTAVIISDMWDQHWCKGATNRADEIAPTINKMIKILREKGVLIIHAPGDTMDFYKDYPGRKIALAAPVVTTNKPLIDHWWQKPEDIPIPLDSSDEGCFCIPKCHKRYCWTKQTKKIEIKDTDAIGDNVEVIYLIRQKGIENIIMTGIHANMCVLNRPYGIRQLINQGLNVVFIRDITDTMYNPKMFPFVDHFTGNDLLIEYIEKYLCATITSDEIIGGKPFRFKDDLR